MLCTCQRSWRWGTRPARLALSLSLSPSLSLHRSLSLSYDAFAEFLRSYSVLHENDDIDFTLQAEVLEDSLAALQGLIGEAVGYGFSELRESLDMGELRRRLSDIRQSQRQLQQELRRLTQPRREGTHCKRGNQRGRRMVTDIATQQNSMEEGQDNELGANHAC